MSSAAPPPASPYPSGNSISRRPPPAELVPPSLQPSRSNGPSPTPQDGRLISELDAEASSRADSTQLSIKLILQDAASALSLSEIYLSHRRRDAAYVEYEIAQRLILRQLPRCPGYPDVVSGRTRSTENQTRLSLERRLAASKDQFSKIRNIIIYENQRSGMSPTASPPPASLVPGMPSSRRHSPIPPLTPAMSPEPPSNGLAHHPPSMIPGHAASPKPNPPPIKPKPEQLHGSITSQSQSLIDRFAALRTASNSKSPLSHAHAHSVGTNGMVTMPDPTDYQRPASVGGPPVPSKLNGPRPMPPVAGLGNVPALPPKLPLNTRMAADMPRPPSPAYSPARNHGAPADINPPRSTARSMVGTGGRVSSVASSRPPGSDYESGSYFPRSGSQASLSDSRRNGMVGISSEKSISPQRLYDFLRMYDILLLDVRNRQDFDEGHIDHSSIICIEPLQLRQGISATDLESSLSIDPDAEGSLFDARDEFQYVVYYDQSTSTTSFLLEAPQTAAHEKLRVLHEALVEFNYDKPLKYGPMLLAGGLDAWVDMMGPNALMPSRTSAARLRRRPVSQAPGLSSSLSIGRRRPRTFNPIEADEERQWMERARSESLHVPAPVDEEVDPEAADDDADGQFYRTREDFLRRFPAVPVEQESMIAPRPIDSRVLSPPPSRPMSQASYFSDGSGQQHHEMPSRPAPAAPRVSYSGAHDRNAIQPHNAVRTRNLPAYISPQEKPSNVRIPKTGLVNFGSTCYMNSVLQCLSATIPLTRPFRDGSYKKWVQRDNWKGSRGLFPEHYANLISNLWVGDVSACRPVTFRKLCARLNGEWGTDRHQDANDFYVFVMEYLHEDLNVFWRNPPPHVLSKEEENARERLPMFMAASIEWDRWSKRERSLISDLFAGQHASQLRCLTCGKTSTTYEPWFNLSVELPVRGNTRLEECLASYCREERLGKGHEWSCPNCQTTRDATKRITLTKAPPYLVVHFKRFRMDGSGSAQKISTVVDFPLQGLDLAPYMMPAPTPKELQSSGRQFDQSTLGPFRYNAYAIVEHFGRGLQYGHYISWVHDRPRNVWRKFDDSTVTDINAVRPAGAYLVFYERVDRFQ